MTRRIDRMEARLRGANSDPANHGWVAADARDEKLLIESAKAFVQLDYAGHPEFHQLRNALLAEDSSG